MDVKHPHHMDHQRFKRYPFTPQVAKQMCWCFKVSFKVVRNLARRCFRDLLFGVYGMCLVCCCSKNGYYADESSGKNEGIQMIFVGFVRFEIELRNISIDWLEKLNKFYIESTIRISRNYLQIVSIISSKFFLQNIETWNRFLEVLFIPFLSEENVYFQMIIYTILYEILFVS